MVFLPAERETGCFVSQKHFGHLSEIAEKLSVIFPFSDIFLSVMTEMT